MVGWVVDRDGHSWSVFGEIFVTNAGDFECDPIDGKTGPSERKDN
jgi:hypothetical protein